MRHYISNWTVIFIFKYVKNRLKIKNKLYNKNI